MVAMPIFRSFLFLLLISFVTLTCSFVPSPSFTTHLTSVSLHPNQAKELEACAYDLMKKQQQEQMNVVRGAQPIKVGPVAWCVRWLTPKERVVAQRQG